LEDLQLREKLEHERGLRRKKKDGEDDEEEEEEEDEEEESEEEEVSFHMEGLYVMI